MSMHVVMAIGGRGQGYCDDIITKDGGGRG